LYKQTILGPLWFFIQPFLTTIIFTIVFGNFAKISTDGIPPILFYMSGIIFWNFFSDCWIKISETFLANQHLFGKVYFPRLLVPVSIVFNNFFKLCIQLFLLVIFWIYFYNSSYDIEITSMIIICPFIIFSISLMGMGLGTLFSSLANKYRDLRYFLQFVVQLFMYASPIVYPISVVPDNYKILILLNPMSSFIEIFKYSITGVGYLNWYWIIYSIVASFILFFIGLIFFNKVEKSFIDTV
jgi:lipopolysaccharide transport system permease protein